MGHHDSKNNSPIDLCLAAREIWERPEGDNSASGGGPATQAANAGAPPAAASMALCAKENSGERIPCNSLYRVQNSGVYMDMGTFSV